MQYQADQEAQQSEGTFAGQSRRKKISHQNSLGGRAQRSAASVSAAITRGRDLFPEGEETAADDKQEHSLFAKPSPGREIEAEGVTGGGTETLVGEEAHQSERMPYARGGARSATNARATYEASTRGLHLQRAGRSSSKAVRKYMVVWVLLAMLIALVGTAVYWYYMMKVEEEKAKRRARSWW